MGEDVRITAQLIEPGFERLMARMKPLWEAAEPLEVTFEVPAAAGEAREHPVGAVT